MTAKHFNQVAAMLQRELAMIEKVPEKDRVGAYNAIRTIGFNLCTFFQQNSKNFDGNKFCAAAGLLEIK